ncbi:MAG: hypothetical protein AB1916_15240 [Thermodesulfobacteriota bacterium]
MKINTEQLRPLESDQESKKARRAETGEGFGELLSRELDAREVVPAPGLRPPPAPLLPHQIATAGEAAATEQSTTAGREVMDKLENILGEWENYASHLAEPAVEDGLRKANGALESIESDVAGLKSRWPGLGKDHPSLQSVVDELEILAVTERIKFNRGDYLE